jgi:dihydroorotate dehydrogenase
MNIKDFSVKILPLLKLLPPQLSHSLGLFFLRYGHILFDYVESIHDPVQFKGLYFKNQLGLAAGFDKNCIATHALCKFGFGHIEVGSITKYRKKKNKGAKIERVFPNSLYNYLGLPNDGFTKINERIKDAKKNSYRVKIGANLAPKDNLEELIFMANNCSSHYITLNISCPNHVVSGQNLRDILGKIKTTKPLFVKIAPSKLHLTKLLHTCLSNGVDGFVVSNSKNGISGKGVLFDANETIKEVRRISPDCFIIGCGGVFTKDDFKKKIDLGANLVQIYTSFALTGGKVINEILYDK